MFLYSISNHQPFTQSYKHVFKVFLLTVARGIFLFCCFPQKMWQVEENIDLFIFMFGLRAVMATQTQSKDNKLKCLNYDKNIKQQMAHVRAAKPPTATIGISRQRLWKMIACAKVFLERQYASRHAGLISRLAYSN